MTEEEERVTPELVLEVLQKRNLCKAGELFQLSDDDVVTTVPQAVPRIIEIINMKDYVESDNDQSVVEICIQRISTALRQTESIEKHTGALVQVLEACQQHSMTCIKANEDPPHAKIASDVMSCLFTRYQSEEVMKQAIPVVVKFLDCGNTDLERNVSSYLSLAAIDKVHLLSSHTQPLLDSILAGNHLLVQVMPQIYPQVSRPVEEKVDQLVALMTERKDATERVYFIQLFAAVAKKSPKLLERHLAPLFQQLDSGLLAPMVAAMFAELAGRLPQAFLPHRARLVQLLDQQPALAALTAQTLAAVGQLSEGEARQAVEQLLVRLEKLEKAFQPLVLNEVRGLCLKYPAVRSEFLDRLAHLIHSSSTAVRILAQQIQEDHQK